MAHDSPFRSGGEPSATPSAQTRVLNDLDRLLRFEIRQAAAQGREAVMGEVLLQVQRIEFPKMLRGNMNLLVEEGLDARLTAAH